MSTVIGLARARTLLGVSTRLWAGVGTHRVDDDWWAALSGIRSVDYNVICWHGTKPTVADGLDMVRQANVPAVQMLAGPALAAAQELTDADWVCIGTTPVMAIDLRIPRGWTRDLSVCPLDPDGLDDVRAVVGATFDVSLELMQVAVPDTVLTDPAFRVWTLVEDGTLKSCVAAVLVEDVLVIWSMATPPRFQRQGFGRRLLTSLLHDAAREGSSWGLLYASSQGEPLYRSIGFEVLEHWQVWSRPRWVLWRG